MKENKLKIVINKSIEEVFEFTINHQNTHLWIKSIQEEKASEYPPKIGTKYMNHWGDFNWDTYEVIEFAQNEIFTLSDINKNYHVKYTYKIINSNKTELEYFEWVKNGKLEKPFKIDVLEKLKFVIETN